MSKFKTSLTAISLSVAMAMTVNTAMAEPTGPHHDGFGPGPHNDRPMEFNQRHDALKPYMSCQFLTHKFHKVDTDKNGFLDQKELAELQKSAQEKVDKKYKDLKKFEEVDLDKNNYVTLDELKVLFPKPEHKPNLNDQNKPNKDEQARGPKPNDFGPHRDGFGPHHDGFGPHPGKGDKTLSTLFKYDLDKDLKLSKDEYNNFIQERKAKQNTCKEIIKNLQNADLNKDGIVILPELDAYIQYTNLTKLPMYNSKSIDQHPIYDHLLPKHPGPGPKPGQEPKAKK